MARYLLRIHYRYSVAENAYDGARIHFAPKKFGRLDDAEAVIRPYPAGTEVTVHYMPQNPSIAVLSTEESESGKLYLLFGLSIFATAMVVILAIAAFSP